MVTICLMRGVQAKMMRDNLVSTPGICSYKIAGTRKYRRDLGVSTVRPGPGGPYA